MSLWKSFQDYSAKYGSQPIDADKLNYIVNNYRDPLAHHPSLETKADMEKQVDKKVNELKKRIEVMAARSTQENRSQKVSSV